MADMRATAARTGPSALLPGVLLCVAITGAATLLQAGEVAWLGQAYLEALVLAILLGVAVRTAWVPGARWQPGVAFSGRILLEIAIVLLGASVSVATVLALGPALLGGIVLTVAAALVSSYGIGRALRLRPRMAALVACGNSICGNSAIVAVAPVIGADAEDVAASIAFTAVLGVVTVLLLPLLVPLLRLSLTQYGVLAGLTVYAVPQVLAATLPNRRAEQPGGHGGQAGARADAGAAGACAVRADAAAAWRRRRAGGVAMGGCAAVVHRGVPRDAGGAVLRAGAGSGVAGDQGCGCRLDDGLDGGAGPGRGCARGGARGGAGDGGGYGVIGCAGGDQPWTDLGAFSQVKASSPFL